jgi:hypothetical protein
MMAVTRWPSYSSGFFFLKLSSGKSGTEHCCGLHECPRQASSRTWCRKMLSRG